MHDKLAAMRMGGRVTWAWLAALSLQAVLWCAGAHASLGDCAQPRTNGSAPTASDCAFVLRAAVGLEACAPECICDVDGNGALRAADGLACLRVAVRIEGAALKCSCPSTTTTTLSTPTTTVASATTTIGADTTTTIGTGATTTLSAVTTTTAGTATTTTLGAITTTTAGTATTTTVGAVTTTTVGATTTTADIATTTTVDAVTTTTISATTTSTAAVSSTTSLPPPSTVPTTTTLPASTTVSLPPSTVTGSTTTTLGNFKRVFVTSTMHDGALGNLAGADAICQARADAAGLGGTWTAWLSNTKKSARDRITDAEYRLVDGTTVVVSSLADILNGILLNAIDMDEFGDLPAPCTSPTQCVWTATFDDGRSDCFIGKDFCCDNWTCNSTGGIPCTNEPAFPATGGQLDVTERWSDDGQDACSVEHHLYCFED